MVCISQGMEREDDTVVDGHVHDPIPPNGFERDVDVDLMELGWEMELGGGGLPSTCVRDQGGYAEVDEGWGQFWHVFEEGGGMAG